MVLTEIGLAKVFQRVKSFVIAQLNSKASVLHTHTYSEITDLPNGYVVDSTLDGTSSNAVSNSAVVDALDGYVPRSGGVVLSGIEYSRTVDNSTLNFNGGTAWDKGAQIQLFSSQWTGAEGEFILYATLNANTRSEFRGTPNGSLTWNGKNIAMAEDTFPRSGGAISGVQIKRSHNNDHIEITGGTDYNSGPSLVLTPYNSIEGWLPQGTFVLHTNNHDLFGYPNGTLTWNGQAVQTVSDQRLKQQIAEIDDKLLDAWEDVDLVQFKYNDAVDQKGDNARLHTGYVVQQIDKACKSHGVDVSQYGLYCHEEYPQETEEVEVEQADGTKTKERKVIREASEHYSLRYTEVYAVECMYLRRENSRLKEKLASLEERLEKLEKAEK